MLVICYLEMLLQSLHDCIFDSGFVDSMNMVKSRLLSQNTLSSTIIGVVPQEPSENRVHSVSKWIDNYELILQSALFVHSV